MPTKEFIIAAVSSNTNSFGLRGFVAVARDGTAFKAAANSLNVPHKGDRLNLALTDAGGVKYAARGWELPEELEPASPAVIRELFKKK